MVYNISVITCCYMTIFFFFFRVGYVFCDPVLASITIVPSLILNHLPKVLDEYHCFMNLEDRNTTLECLENITDGERLDRYAHMEPWDRQRFLAEEVSLQYPSNYSFIHFILSEITFHHFSLDSKFRDFSYFFRISYFLVISI